MGIWDVLSVGLEIVDMFSDKDTYYDFECTTLELFEIGTSWKGTARVHGAGNHISTNKVNYSKRIAMPHEDLYNKTKREILRERVITWASETFSSDKKLSKESLVLNEGENCLSFEGFAKKVGNEWKLVSKISEAKAYASFKIEVSKSNETIGYSDLKYLFKEACWGRVTSVDVKDGW